MIKIDGYELFGVTKFVKGIKHHNYFDYEVIWISRVSNIVRLHWIPDTSVEKGDFVVKPKYLLDPRNCKYYQDYLRSGRKEATYNDVRENLIELMINCEDEDLKEELDIRLKKEYDLRVKGND